MRYRSGFLAASILFCCSIEPSIASEILKFGPSPAWVVPAKVPDQKPGQSGAPIAILLNDQQFLFEPGKVTLYTEGAIRIQNEQGLAAGNISIPWQPATDTVTVNKLGIRRGNQLIDILASGQSFTTVRREANLEAATLDGQLTANIQPEGLQEGDVIEFATTIERSDPVLQGHVETAFALFSGLPISQGRARLTWPKNMKVKTRVSDLLPEPKTKTEGTKQVIELVMEEIEPPAPPKNAPPRYGLGFYAEASDYASWAEVADLMRPLFLQASVIPASGPLRSEVERIRDEGKTPETRTELALALVQKRVRYVALLMGSGNYRPANAEETWSRRFGDCKGKTALLLGLLRELGVEARPVLVSSTLGDALPQRLPMLGAFDHVIVQATVGGRPYFLDGTRSGDRKLTEVATPYFAWGLPVAENASLIRILPEPLSVPTSESIVQIDARAGARAPASANVEVSLRGEEATQLNALMSMATGKQRDEFLRAYWKSTYGFVTVDSTDGRLDSENGEYRLIMSGTAKLDWDGGFRVPGSSLAYKADFERASGAGHDAPVAIGFPAYRRSRTTIRLPAGFFAGKRAVIAPVQETLAGVEYKRAATITGETLVVETSERSIVPEIPYVEARRSEARLRTLWDEDVLLRLPASYRQTAQDVAALDAEKPRSADEFLDRGNDFLDDGQYDKAIADFTAALALNPNSAPAYGSRGITYVWKGDYAAAEKDLAKAEELRPQSAVVYRARGLMAEQRGEFANAVEAYTNALESNPKSSFALGHRGRAYMALGDKHKALADFESALRIKPTWTELRLARANILFELGDREAVAREADLLTSENGDSDYALVAAARIYARLGMKKEMGDAFDQALALGPKAYIYLNRAQTRPKDDRQGRLSDMQAALKLEPDNPDILAEAAEQNAENGDFSSALKLYGQAIEKDRTEKSFAIRRAIIQYRAGDKAAAEKVLADLRPSIKSAMDLNNLCWAKATAGILLESALQDCDDSLRLAADSAAVMDSRALVLLRLGRLDEAIGEYGKAIDKGIGAASYMGRALAHARKGDKARAEADRAQALKLDADVETRFVSFGLKL